ncbi:MAG: APC family permease [Bacteriovoracaceae bacterium]
MKNKKLNLWTAISVVIGCVIGSGVFVKPGRVLIAAGDSNRALLAWVIGGLISLAGGLTLAEISARIPKNGGVYAYVEELFGESWAFVTGWLQAIIYGPALSSALSLYFASLLIQFLGISDSYQKFIALFTLFILSTLSACSLHFSAIVQNLTTTIKLIPIFVLGIAGLWLGEEQIFSVATTSTTVPNMGVAILATLWAYDGWVQVSNLAEEIEEPSKNLPRAYLIGIFGVMIAYILVNISLFHILPVEMISTLNEKAPAIASEKLFGAWGGKALALGILISIFGCLNGNIMTLSRMAYAMSCRNAFPFSKVMAVLHPKTNTPVNSIILKTALAVVMVVLLNPDRITDIAMFIIYLCYAAVFLGVFILRKRLGAPTTGYKVPLYPVMPILASLGSLYICYSMAVQQPLDAGLSILVALSGIPIFYYRKMKLAKYAVQ